LQNEKAAQRIKELKVENEQLKKQIENAKKQLIQLEIKNGKKQVPLPGQKAAKPKEVEVKQEVAAPVASKPEGQPSTEPKEKKPKKEKAPPAAAEPEAPIDVGRLDMRVGKIVEVQRHPDADALYLEKIDVGEAAPRTIISGLVKHVPIDQMQDRLVIVLCNLKPAKMRGILSEGMVMCASTPEKVEILAPPAGSAPGDLVSCEGYPRVPDAVMNPKKKIFETVAPDLLTNDNLMATYKGALISVDGKGPVVAQTLKNVPIK
jgi:aminoacyl tRNA synthase complex-interacting multifunctional protein 1